jgi:hopene-associated glycosyltransferase HpnB
MMWTRTGAALAALSLLGWVGLALLRGGFWRVRLAPGRAEPARWPEVVAVLPARDEAGLIATTIAALLRQDYPGRFHVILVDDHSSDGSAALAAAAAGRIGCRARLAVVRARALPAGWAGKVWAQSEGLAVQRRHFRAARYVFLTDADILHQRRALRRLVARAEAGQYVLTSLMVRLRCASLAERALMPAFVFFFAMLYPFSRVNNPRSRVAAAAGGCMLVRTDALAGSGGIAAIRDELIDDCALAARLKPHGPIRLDLARDSWSLRRYDDWADIWNMVARTAYTQLRYSRWRLAATVLGMLSLYLVPPAFALGLAPGTTAWTARAAWLVIMALYMPMLRYYRQSPLWAPALPAVALFYLGATLASAWRYSHGQGGQWKGRAQALPRRIP